MNKAQEEHEQRAAEFFMHTAGTAKKLASYGGKDAAFIYGNGGHAKVVREILRLEGQPSITYDNRYMYFRDDETGRILLSSKFIPPELTGWI